MVENELKFVLRGHSGLMASLSHLPTVRIDQAYLTPETRIRRRSRVDGWSNTVLGFKRRLPNGRNLDVEGEISAEEFEELWSVATHRLSKERIHIEDGEISWDIDVFMDGGGLPTIVLAEAEMPPEMEAPPSIPLALAGLIAFSVPRDDSRFSARLLSDVSYARSLASAVGADADGTAGQ